MKILSYNIQAAIGSNSYWSYLTQSHRQLFPCTQKMRNLANIAQFISAFDVFCLQEIELGGLRNGFANQVQQLLAQTPFTHYVYQTNRVIGKLSRHGNVILSRLPITECINTLLPARISGRGILAVRTETLSGSLVIANTHLSLGTLDQFRQLRFIRQKLQTFEHVCLLGDFNCTVHDEPLTMLTDHDFTRISSDMPTYPSWQPCRTLDHAFIKGHLNAQSHVIPFYASDHLPISVELS